LINVIFFSLATAQKKKSKPANVTKPKLKLIFQSSNRNNTESMNGVHLTCKCKSNGVILSVLSENNGKYSLQNLIPTSDCNAVKLINFFVRSRCVLQRVSTENNRQIFSRLYKCNLFKKLSNFFKATFLSLE